MANGPVNIFSKFRKSRSERNDLEDVTSDKFISHVNFINKIALIFGLEFRNDWNFNNRTKIAVLAFSTTWWILFYTFYLQFPTLNTVELCGGTCLVIMVHVKFVTVVFVHKRFMSLLNFLVKVYKENNVPGSRNSILEDTLKTISKHCRYVLGGVFFGNGLYSVYPFYDFTFNGNFTLVSPLLFPFVDHTKLKGYFMSTFLNIVIATYLIALSFAFSCLFLTNVDVFSGLVTIVEHDLQVFDGMVETNKQSESNEHKKFFRNILSEMMDLARFNEFMNQLYNICAAVQVCCCCCGILCVLFGYLANDYIGGIGAASFYSTELMMFCYIGQLMQNEGDRMAQVVYNSKWYTYDVACQRDLLFALNVIQNIKHITLAVYPLNFATGLMVYKNIYTVLMMMLKFLDLE